MRTYGYLVMAGLLLFGGCGEGGSAGGVEGVVIDIYGSTLGGVTVEWTSKSLTTTTDTEGNFSFSGSGTVNLDLRISGAGLVVTVVPAFQYDTSLGGTATVVAMRQGDFSTVVTNYMVATGDTYSPASDVFVVARLRNKIGSLCPHTATVTDVGGPVTPAYGEDNLQFDVTNDIPESSAVFSFGAIAAPGGITVTDDPTSTDYTATAAAGEVFLVYDEELDVYTVIEGQVRDWQGGATLSGITVQLDGSAVSDTTDGYGEFTLTGVTPNQWGSLTLSGTGYFTTHYPDMLIPLASTPQAEMYIMATADFATTYQTPLETEHGAGIVLGTDALVAGDFREDDGYTDARITGATLEEDATTPEVDFYYRDTTGVNWNVAATEYTTFNSGPQFFGIAAGVTAGDHDFDEKWHDVFEVTAHLEAGHMTVLPFLGVLREVRISGNCTDTIPAPLVGIDVELLDEGGTVVASAVTDASGDYALPPVPGYNRFCLRVSDPGGSPAIKPTLTAYRSFSNGAYSIDLMGVDNAAYAGVKALYETRLGRVIDDTTYGAVAGNVVDSGDVYIRHDTVVLSDDGAGLFYISETTGQFDAPDTETPMGGPQFMAAEVTPGLHSAYETIYGNPFERATYRTEAGAVTLAYMGEQTYSYIDEISSDVLTVRDSTGSAVGAGIDVRLAISYPWWDEDGAGMTLSGVTNASGQVTLTYRELEPVTHYVVGEGGPDRTICSTDSSNLYILIAAEVANLQSELDVAAGSPLDYTTKGLVVGYLGGSQYHTSDDPAVGNTVELLGTGLPSYYEDSGGGMTNPFTFTHSLWQFAVPEADVSGTGEHVLEVPTVFTNFSDPLMLYYMQLYLWGHYYCEAGTPSLNVLNDSWFQFPTQEAFFRVGSGMGEGSSADGIQGAQVTLAYKDGPTYSSTTGLGGFVYFPNLPATGETTLTVQKAGYITTVIPAVWTDFILWEFDYIYGTGSDMMLVEEDMYSHLQFMVDSQEGAGTLNENLSAAMSMWAYNGALLSIDATGAGVYYPPITYGRGALSYTLDDASDMLPGPIIYNIPVGSHTVTYQERQNPAYRSEIPLDVSGRTFFMLVPGGP